MLSLLSRGFVVKDFKHATTIFCFGYDENHKIIYRPAFLDNVRITNDNGGLFLQLVKDVRDLMVEIIEFSGTTHKELNWHIERGVPEAIMNFLNKATDNFIDFMGVFDPEYLLNDPMIWSFEDKVVRSWYFFMFMEDNPRDPGLTPYFMNFPKDWKNNVRSASFLDEALTMHVRKDKINRLKVNLADTIISQMQQRKRKREPQSMEYEDILHEYEKDLELAQRQRGLDTYKNYYGVRWIVKMKRNGLNHHNQNSVDLKRPPLKTLKSIVEMVESEFKFSCSRLFWFCNDLWFDGMVKNWEYHKEMLKGEKSMARGNR